MANRRKYTDDQLRDAVAGALCWSDVMEAIGKGRREGRDSVKAVVARLGLDTSHFDYPRTALPKEAEALPFNDRAPKNGQTGLGIATSWFMDRGYIVSIPLHPTTYDLVVESDVGLKRIQVKVTDRRGRNGRYSVSLKRSIYDPSVPRSARGHYRHVRYEPGTVDYFFVVAKEAKYLLPFHVVEGLASVVLDVKYRAFKVSDVCP